jgi:trk system potassium uptake protein TrkH
MGSLIFIGGLGIPVLSDFFTHKLRFRFSLHTQLTLFVVFILTAVGWFGIFLSEAVQPGVLSEFPLDEQLVRSLFQSVSNRTAGFAGLPDFNALAPATGLLIICMMFIGCAPASMGGGITTGTLVVLLVALRSYVQGLPHARVRGRSIGNQTVRRAGAVLTVACVLLAMGMWLIMITNPHLTFDEVFFEVVSAFATCGLSLGVTNEFNWFGRLIIMMMMFWGRLGTLTVVIALVQRSDPHADLVQYPEAQVLIG